MIDDPMIEVALQLMTHPQTGFIRACHARISCQLAVDDIPNAESIYLYGLRTTLSELVSMSICIAQMPPGTGLVGSPWPSKKVYITLYVGKELSSAYQEFRLSLCSNIDSYDMLILLSCLIHLRLREAPQCSNLTFTKTRYVALKRCK